jgi:hypothetical protein
MLKNIKYALLASFIAYLLALVAMFFFSLSQSGLNHVSGDNAKFMMDMVTLGLSNNSWWGAFWYLAGLVPWLFSALVLALALKFFVRTDGRRATWSGLSVAIYYAVVLLVFAIGKLVTFWGHIDAHPGDLVYAVLIVWPIGGFIVGYFAAILTEKILKTPSAA